LVRIIACFFGVLVCLLTQARCAAGKPYQGPFNVPSLSLKEGGDITQNGVTIGVAPVTRSTAQNYPIAKTVEWKQLDPGDPNSNPPDRRRTVPTFTRSGAIYLIPLPAFQIGIKNQSGAPLDLSHAQFEVVDDRQRRYSIYRNGADLKARLYQDTTYSDPYIAGDRAMVDGLMSSLDQLNLPTTTTVVPDGQQWLGYLVLNSDAHNAREYYALMSSVQSFTVRIKDIPTRGGQPSEFTFVVEKSQKAVSLNCPGELRDPDPDRCQVSAP
jgi:hypothetical protein